MQIWVSTEGVIPCSLAFIHSCSGCLTAGSGSRFNIRVGVVWLIYQKQPAVLVRLAAVQFSSAWAETPSSNTRDGKINFHKGYAVHKCVRKRQKSVKEMRGVWKEESIYLWRRDIESDHSKRNVLAGLRSHTAWSINTTIQQEGKAALESSVGLCN